MAVRRRRLWKLLAVVGCAAVAGILARSFLYDENFLAILVARRPGTRDSGASLTHNTPGTGSRPVPNGTATTEPAQPLRLTFKKLGSWQFIEGKTPIPAEVRALDGKRVEISGFMWSNSRIQQLTEFILVQSLWSCCFGQVPDMNHFLEVKLPPGRWAEYYPHPVTLTGKLSVGELWEGGHLRSLYRLEAEEVVVR